jgi:hypothetical protein
MHALALLIIGFSGFVSFAKAREGAGPALAVGEGVLFGTSLTLILGAGTLWLTGATASEVIAVCLMIMGFVCLTALLGGFVASIRPRREPIAHW